MTSKRFGHFRIINSWIMRSTRAWVSVASLALLVTLAKAYPGCGYRPPCEPEDPTANIPSAICSGAQVVTYGDPCFCKESLPYTVEIPKPVPTPVETLKSYGYSVITPPTHCSERLQLPVKIQRPTVDPVPCDTLSGRSYGICVQHEPQCPAPKSYSFDCTVQKAVKPQKVVYKPSMSISFEHVHERIDPRLSPLPIAVQTPLQYRVPERRLTGLTSTVDRVLIPACEVSGCPDCNDIVKTSSQSWCS